MTQPVYSRLITQDFERDKNLSNLFRSHSVSLADDWDDVDLVVQLLHELNVKRLQTLNNDIVDMLIISEIEDQP